MLKIEICLKKNQFYKKINLAIKTKMKKKSIKTITKTATTKSRFTAPPCDDIFCFF